MLNIRHLVDVSLSMLRPRTCLITMVFLFAFRDAVAFEKRSEPDPVEGVPKVYWALFRGGITEDENDDFRAKLPFESITLERTPCFGASPVYTVTLHRSGKAELHAVKNMPKSGDFVGEIDPLSYGRLCYFMEHSHFSDFKNVCQPPIRWTDDSTCIVTARLDGGVVKKVSDYGTVGPIQLWAIQQLIDGFRERVVWKPK